MKKIVSLLAVIAVIFSFCACGSSNENNVDDSVSTPVSNEPLRPENHQDTIWNRLLSIGVVWEWLVE